MAKRLTDASVRGAKPGVYGDEHGLRLRVLETGARQFIWRGTIKGKRRDVGLGGYPYTSLAEARQTAFECRKLARAGGDPLAAKRRARTPAFREAAEKTFQANRPRWRNEKVEKNWMQQLERHAFPTLGDMPVNEIGREDVLRVLTPIWSEKPEAARKVRQRIRAILKWAIAHGFIEHNAAGEAIDGALPTMPAVKQHFRALPYREVAAALETVEDSNASMPAKLCMRFIVLTAVRSGEARNATWAEIDLDAREWRIPASRMKANVEHRVPLSDAAVEVLEQALPLSGGEGLVFPSLVRRGQPMSDMTLTKVLRTTGLAEHATVHGFRSSFRDWCADTGKPREIAEAALAHTVGGVEGAYFRSDLFERRRALMEQWAAYLGGGSAMVVKLRG